MLARRLPTDQCRRSCDKLWPCRYFSVCVGFSMSGIDFRLGDGLSTLHPGEVDVVCAAGIAAGPAYTAARKSRHGLKLRSHGKTQASCLHGSRRRSLRSALCCSPACQPAPRLQGIMHEQPELVHPHSVPRTFKIFESLRLGREAMMELRCRMSDFGWALQDEVLSIGKGWATGVTTSWLRIAAELRNLQAAQPLLSRGHLPHSRG